MFLVETDYAPNFRKQAFYAIKPGDGIARVVDVLGVPLFYRVISTNHQVTFATSENIDDFKHWQTNNEVLIYFEYSRPKKGKENFQAWQVLIQAGVVKETRHFT